MPAFSGRVRMRLLVARLQFQWVMKGDLCDPDNDFDPKGTAGGPFHSYCDCRRLCSKCLGTVFFALALDSLEVPLQVGASAVLGGPAAPSCHSHRLRVRAALRSGVRRASGPTAASRACTAAPCTQAAPRTAPPAARPAWGCPLGMRGGSANSAQERAARHQNELRLG